ASSATSPAASENSGPAVLPSGDSVTAAIRDDSRFALIRAEATVTVETGERFLQLSDGVGEYMPGPGER
ncbi:hypothetical protein, partial [Klebsiella aerogenes]|uniref:hypothetical protein n=1 Tax=Klebsiella aerogenes TaxID=548 RepID=UPI0019541F61